VSLGDLNGDGSIDAFVSNRYVALDGAISGANSVVLNDGTGNFAAGDQIHNDLQTNANRSVLGDIDGDGDLDAFLIGGAFDNRILLNDGTGGFQYSGQSLGPSARNIAVGDLDGDGDLDAFVIHAGYIDIFVPDFNQVWLNDGTGNFEPGSVYSSTANIQDISLADFDGDGDLDALIGGDGNSDRLWLNDGNAGFTDSGTVGPASPVRVVVGDVNGDQTPDLLFTDFPNQTQVWLNDGNGNFSDSGNRLGSGFETRIALGDLDADGDLDAVLGGSNDPETVWLNNGTGAFSFTGQVLTGVGTTSIELADLDGDGDLDLFSAARENGISRIWLNQDQPVVDQVDLPDGGGTFEMLVDAGDLVVREQGGDELFRQAQTDVPRLLINGGEGDDTLIVDFSGGNPIPVSRLDFHAGGQSSGDALILGSGSVGSVSHSFTSDTDGSVIIDGAMIAYTGVEPVTDGLTADRRYFTYGAAADDVTLEDNGATGDGISRIANATSGRTIDFANPSERLQILTGLGDDTLTLTAVDSLFTGNILASGSDGNDFITAANDFPAVQLSGSSGDDTLIGSMNDDTLIGSAGDDILNGRGGNDTLTGVDGDDVLLGGSGRDLLEGGNGADRLLGQGGNDDTLIGGSGVDSFDGGAGRDWLISIVKSNGVLTDNEFTVDSDIESVSSIEMTELIQLNITSTAIKNALIDASGFSGHVTLRGGAGNDTLIGGSNDDSLEGGAGNDSISGGDGHDWLDGGDGDDTLNGGSGNDSLSGGFGNDAIAGMSGNDWLNGNRDNDTLLGGEGDDTLLGGGQDDTLLGEAGDDFIKGHDGNDLVSGGGQGSSASGNDTVDGETINDAFTLDAPWAEV
tara:strand:+ start:135652 stop:138216 length:2565 start_codon:yes stop_codon:yes gene_type:complete